MAEAGALLKLNNVSIGYGGPDVVRNATLTLMANQNLSVIGPNGCGKTTLLKAIAALLPFKGEIEIGGRPFRKMKHREITSKIALLSQTSGIYFTYTVYDTVMMGRYLHIKDKLLGLPSEADKNCVRRCLEAVDLLPDAEKEITKLSGGQLQRVFLARVLAQEPEVILLDEPTNHLDLKYQIEIIEYLKNWAADGKRAVIGVLHDINLAMRLGDSVMVMKDGEIQACGKTDEVVTADLLEKVYGIDVARYMTESLKRWETVK